MNKISSVLFSVLRFLLIIAFCIGVSLAIVFPLWKFATSNPAAYTIVTIFLIAAAAIFLLTKKIFSKIKQVQNIKKEKSDA